MNYNKRINKGERMPVKAMDLFEAYAQNELPKEEGYIVSSFFHASTAYAIYEVVSYSGVKSIYSSETGITFQTNGKKLYILIEPASYPYKATEPYLRVEKEQIPLRFNELEIITAKNQSRMIISKEPQTTLSSFTILKPTGINFALVFYRLPDLYDSLALFFEKTFNREAGIPQADAKKGAKQTVAVIQKTMSFRLVI
jgi:hypothetical protein